MFGITTRQQKRALLFRARDFVLMQHKGDCTTEVIGDTEQGIEVKYRLEFHRNGVILLAREKNGRTTWFRQQDETFKAWFRKVPMDLLKHKTNPRRLRWCPSRVPRPRVAPLS